MAIGQKVSSSLRWMAGMRAVGQVFTWASTLIVIRILSPEDYGLMAMATIVVAFLDNINEMGLASAIVQRKDLQKRLVEQIFGLLLLFNAVIYILLYAGAPYIAEFFNDDRLTLIVRVLGLQVIITAFLIVPDSIMTRNMDFRRVSLIEFFSLVSASLTTLLFAYFGYGVWALIYGNLMAAFARTVATIYVSRYFCMPRFNFSGIGSALNFGGLVTIHRMLYYYYVQVDIFIIGKVLGKELLGYFAVAAQLASLPMEKFSAILNEVGFSAFSQIQDNRRQINEHLCKALRILGLIAFPVFFGISCVAPELILVFLGEKWQPAAMPLQILSVVMALKMMNITDPVLFALGRPDVGVKVLLIGCVLMTIGCLIGVQWGLLGASLAWLIVYPIHFYITLIMALPVIGMSIGRYIGAFITPVIFSGIMYIAVIIAREALSPLLLHPILQLIMLIGIGALTYSLLVILFQRKVLFELLSMVRH